MYASIFCQSTRARLSMPRCPARGGDIVTLESLRDASFYLECSRGDENYLQTTATGYSRAPEGFIGPWEGRNAPDERKIPSSL